MDKNQLQQSSTHSETVVRVKQIWQTPSVEIIKCVETSLGPVPNTPDGGTPLVGFS